MQIDYPRRDASNHASLFQFFFATEISNILIFFGEFLLFSAWENEYQKYVLGPQEEEEKVVSVQDETRSRCNLEVDSIQDL